MYLALLMAAFVADSSHAADFASSRRANRSLSLQKASASEEWKRYNWTDMHECTALWQHLETFTTPRDLPATETCECRGTCILWRRSWNIDGHSHHRFIRTCEIVDMPRCVERQRSIPARRNWWQFEHCFVRVEVTSRESTRLHISDHPNAH